MLLTLRFTVKSGGERQGHCWALPSSAICSRVQFAESSLWLQLAVRAMQNVMQPAWARGLEVDGDVWQAMHECSSWTVCLLQGTKCSACPASLQDSLNCRSTLNMGTKNAPPPTPAAVARAPACSGAAMWATGCQVEQTWLALCSSKPASTLPSGKPAGFRKPHCGCDAEPNSISRDGF